MPNASSAIAPRSRRRRLSSRPRHYYLGATELSQVELWEVLNLCSGKEKTVQLSSHSFWIYLDLSQMVYIRARGNIRKPRRRRATKARVTRRTYARRRPQARRRIARKIQSHVCSEQLTPTAKFALAQIDPFDPKCLGAKIPDSNTMPSIANQDVDQVGLAVGSDAATVPYAIAFSPAYQQAILKSGVSAGGINWSINGWQNRRNRDSVNQAIEGIRPVAHAIRMSCPLAPTSTTGFVHVGLAIENRYGASSGVPDFPTSVNEMTGLPHYRRFTLASLTQSPVTAINKWIDETAFRYDAVGIDQSFSDPAATLSDTTFNFNRSWAFIIVMVEAPPASSTVLSFEHLLSTEALPRRNAFIMGNLAAPNSPGTMSAVSSMQAETDFVHTEAEQESYISQAVNELRRGAESAGEAAVEYVQPIFSRIGRYAADTAINYAVNAYTGTGGISGVNSNPNRLITS